tara:strand:+ start:577 stop:822 length:246 start_codon:yes stop_codon:yes gene_type:complete
MNLLRAEGLVTHKSKIADGEQIEEIFLLAKYECEDCPEETSGLFDEEQPICFTCGGKGTYDGIVPANNVVKLLNSMIMRTR